MTGPEHYTEAESDLEHAARASDRGRPDDAAYYMQSAQVHATLSLAAATALGGGDGPPAPDWDAWYRAASEGPGEKQRKQERMAADLADLATEVTS